MPTEDPNREETIFAAALKLPAPERVAYLHRECAEDAALCERVQSLLKAHAEAGTFIDQTVVGQEPIQVRTEDNVPGGEQCGERIGRYKLLEKIGEGGFGDVWMAEQEEPVRRRVALKIIKLGMDTREVVARFEAERQALALMDHPNIARILDGGVTGDPLSPSQSLALRRGRGAPSAGGRQARLEPSAESQIANRQSQISGGRPYFVMELVRGVPITKYCDEHRLSVDERLELFMQVCQAVQHAHQKGIIHRDLKPSNVLVSVQEDRPVPKVIDFGIAKATQQRLTEKTLFTRFHQFVGTPAYMSPEQTGANREDIDTRSDIYSLGVLLYELLTGKTPFDTQKLLEAGYEAILRTIREQEPPKPSTRLSALARDDLTELAAKRQLAPEKLGRLLRGELDWIVMKCLEKDRTRRYETANVLAQDLQRHLNNEPVVAAPPSATYRIARFARRHRVALATSGAFAFVLVAGALTSTWQAVRASRFAKEAGWQRGVATNEAARATKLLGESERARENAESQRKRAEFERAEVQRLLYITKINLAQHAWEADSMIRLRQLLDETKEYPEKGFEWFYWWQQSHREARVLRLRQPFQPMKCLIISANCQRFVTASYDQYYGPVAKVWEAISGRELLTLIGHTQEVTAAAVSLDGQRIVTGSNDRTARLWDGTSGKQLLSFERHSGPVDAVAISPDGRRIATVGLDAKLWDASTGQELTAFTGHTNRVNYVAFSPDGQWVLSSSGEVKVWEAATGRLVTGLREHRAVLPVACSPDKRWIVTGSFDHTAKVWEAMSGKELLTLNGHDAPVWSVAFSPGGDRIATGSADSTVKAWDSTTGRLLNTFKGHVGTVRCVAFSPDGQRIFTAGGDMIRVWGTPTGLALNGLKVHTSRIVSLAFSSDGQRIVTGSDDNTAKVLESATARELLTFSGHKGRITSVAISHDGHRIATSSSDQTLKVWDSSSGHELLTLTQRVAQIESVAFSPDGQRIASCGKYDGRAFVWDSATGKELLALTNQWGEGWTRIVAFSPDGRMIASGGEGPTAKLWEAANGRRFHTLKGHTDAILSLVFSADGKLLLTGSRDRTAKVWDVESGSEAFSLRGHAGEVSSVAFFPEHKRIITRGEDGKDVTVKLWEAVSGRELLTLKLERMPLTYAGISAVVVSPDGQRIITGHNDGTLRTWEAASPDQVATWKEEGRPAAE